MQADDRGRSAVLAAGTRASSRRPPPPPGTRWLSSAAVPDALEPVERLTLAFLAALAAVAAASHPTPLATLGAIAGVAAAVVGVAALGARGRPWAAVRVFFPVASVIAIFSLCGPLIAVANPHRYDAALAALDARLFGDLAAMWRGALGRPSWLTDAASAAYCTYYAIPVAIAAALWWRDRTRELEVFVFAAVATFFTSYVGYFLVPALGPRVPEADEAAVLGGGAISAAVRAFLRGAEANQLDAFPSGHTALALVYLALGWRFLPRWRAVLALLVAGIVFATVYLSLHYVVDIAAGALLAAAMPALLPGLRRVFGASPYAAPPLAAAAERELRRARA